MELVDCPVTCLSRINYPTTATVKFTREENFRTVEREMERVRRVELPTLCLASIRSSQLSYTRMLLEVHEENDFVNLLKITLRQPCLEQAKKLQVIIYAGPKRDGSGQGQKVHPRGKEIQSPVRVMYEQANDGECLKNEFIFP